MLNQLLQEDNKPRSSRCIVREEGEKLNNYHYFPFKTILKLDSLFSKFAYESLIIKKLFSTIYKIHAKLFNCLLANKIYLAVFII